jgi:hypothetical protein
MKKSGKRVEPASAGSAARQALSNQSASKLIDARIDELGDWRGEMLARLRALIKQADPQVVEEWKWGIPVWSHNGIISTGETYKKAVKMTFAKGAFLDDPDGLFNSSLGGRVRRAIDFSEGAKVNEKALKTLIQRGVPPALPGRQQQFDIFGSPSKKLQEVSRQAHIKENPDGRV